MMQQILTPAMVLFLHENGRLQLILIKSIVTHKLRENTANMQSEAEYGISARLQLQVFGKPQLYYSRVSEQ